jgi:hypothetical protein
MRKDPSHALGMTRVVAAQDDDNAPRPYSVPRPGRVVL